MNTPKNENSKKIRVISDVHGNVDQYQHLIHNVDYSIQLGDFGFGAAYKEARAHVDPEKHKILGGNHDDYVSYYNSPHTLGDYGNAKHGGLNFFYVRGAFSIDFAYRVLKFIGGSAQTWWEEEELSQGELREAALKYVQSRPDVMLTHDCPWGVCRRFSNLNIMQNFGFTGKECISRTQIALEVMRAAHAPKLWIFAHHHKNLDFEFEGTRYICRAELGYIDINPKTLEIT